MSGSAALAVVPACFELSGIFYDFADMFSGWATVLWSMAIHTLSGLSHRMRCSLASLSAYPSNQFTAIYDWTNQMSTAKDDILKFLILRPTSYVDFYPVSLCKLL